jgi:hypothetical protein
MRRTTTLVNARAGQRIDEQTSVFAAMLDKHLPVPLSVPAHYPSLASIVH